ncbi:MAG: hypothetical protein K0M64_12430 [Rhizobium sp.]|nr:hypothetical protein [Rhizobium sp.]
MRRLIPALLLLLLPAFAHGARWSEPDIAGLVTDGAIDEISGLAASRSHPGHYWAINDSGSSAELHLVDGRGRHRGSVPVEGVPNVDWEDLSSFELGGRRYLLIADTGDNGGLRQELQLYVIEEPASLDQPARLAWTRRFRWPDGPRDCEAATVDPVAGEVLLVSKKRVPPELFRVPLRGDEAVVAAEFLGTLRGIAQPSSGDLLKNPVYGRYRAQVTGASLSPNGRVLAVLNYRALHFLVRGPGASWPQALENEVSALDLPWLPQAEAVAFDADGAGLAIGSEQLPSPFLRYRVKPAPR